MQEDDQPVLSIEPAEGQGDCTSGLALDAKP
jgi:hypothetical protein